MLFTASQPFETSLTFCLLHGDYSVLCCILFIFIKSIYKPHDREKVTFTFSVPSTFPALLSLCSQTVMEVNTERYVQGRLHPSGICAGEG